MHSDNTGTVVGVFEDRNRADEAVGELLKMGFPSDRIGVAMRHSGATTTTSVANADDADNYAGSGAVTGAMTGLGLGALVGLGVLSGVVPVVGPAIAAGTLGVVLSNAAAGAGIAGLVGALVGAGIPQEEAEYYQGEFESGRTIVSVSAGERRAEASAILNAHGAYDVVSRGPAGSAKGY